jgi:hypothetical protein
VLETDRDHPPELLRFPYLSCPNELARDCWAAGERATGVAPQDEASVAAEVDRLRQQCQRHAAMKQAEAQTGAKAEGDAS